MMCDSPHDAYQDGCEWPPSIIPNWPDAFCATRGERIPPDLIGARIIGVGTLGAEDQKKFGMEGGGFVIEYEPTCSNNRIRIYLSLNELGMWVVHQEIRERR